MRSDKKYKMPCGCEFDLIDNTIKENDGMPPIQIDFSNIRNCPMVWDMLAKGNTKGVFQLETSTGEQWSTKSKPKSIDDISALLSIIRPGVLKSHLNGKSLAEHYTDRKNNGEHIEYISEHLEPLLSQNQGIMLYQEDCLAIAKEIAGFSLAEAETLRKAIGKKSAELMAELKPKFLEGCEKVGKVNKETAEIIFSWLEESQKYGFNKCILGDTKVNTKRGLITITELEIDDLVLCPNDFDKDSYYKVLNIFYQGEKEVYEITLSSGHKIGCTLDHKFKTNYGIQSLNKILENSSMILIENKQYANIINRVYLGIKPTYDIEIDKEDHIFYANGIATSNSHSVSYAKLSYATAYMKVHFPLHFFASSLYWAKEKINEKDEISELVYEAKKFGVDIMPPNLSGFRLGKFGFHIMNNKIYFGLSNIKGIGESACKKLLSVINLQENKVGKTIDKFTWIELLVLIFTDTNKTLVRNSISVGMFDHLKINRKKMLFDYDTWSQINDNEKELVKNKYKEVSKIEECLDLLNSTSREDGGPKTENRRKLIADLRKLCDSPPFSLYDNREWISKTEKELMGVTLTASVLEGSNTSNADTTCKEFNSGKTGSCSIACIVSRVNEYTIKKGKQTGQKMGAMTVQDDTDKIQSVLIFADAWEANKDKLYPGASVILFGQKSKQNDSFLVSKVRNI